MVLPHGIEPHPSALQADAHTSYAREALNGRRSRIRTCDPSAPNGMLYQTEPRADYSFGAVV